MGVVRIVGAQDCIRNLAVARGTRGGRCSTEWTITPHRGIDGETGRRALGALASSHAELLDCLLGGLVWGKREPTMKHNPLATGFGWELSSRFTPLGLLRIRSRLADMLVVSPEVV